MKARTNTQSKNKTTRKNNPAFAFADAKWYQNFVRHVELREFSPRTREAYLAWPRRLQSAIGRREITKLRESAVADLLISLRHEHGLKDATVNQAVCAMRAFYRDHLGRDWKGWGKIKIWLARPRRVSACGLPVGSLPRGSHAAGVAETSNCPTCSRVMRWRVSWAPSGSAASAPCSP